MLTYEEFCNMFKGKPRGAKYRKENGCFLYAKRHGETFISLSGTGDYEGRRNYCPEIKMDADIIRLYELIKKDFFELDKVQPICCKLTDDTLTIRKNVIYTLRNAGMHRPIEGGLFSCCERKLLAHFKNCVYCLNECVIYCKYLPCFRCSPFFNDSVEYYFYNDRKTKDYSLKRVKFEHFFGSYRLLRNLFDDDF